MTAQQLKNSILQMAVQGKLVPQDPNDEPASVLLERIRAEKERLIKEKKIKREKNPSVIFKGADNTPYEKIGDEVRSLVDLEPFEIPSSWEWCRVGDLFSNMSGLSYKKDTLAIKTDKMVRVLRGGYKFPTGGGFYFSDSGGPNVSGSVSLSLPAPYNFVSISVGLGNRSTTSGLYVTVPNKTDYFKLYVEKEMEVRPYAIYKQNKHTREYELYDVGAVSVLYKLSAYAKKV